MPNTYYDSVLAGQAQLLVTQGLYITFKIRAAGITSRSIELLHPVFVLSLVSYPLRRATAVRNSERESNGITRLPRGNVFPFEGGGGVERRQY